MIPYKSVSNQANSNLCTIYSQVYKNDLARPFNTGTWAPAPLVWKFTWGATRTQPTGLDDGWLSGLTRWAETSRWWRFTGYLRARIFLGMFARSYSSFGHQLRVDRQDARCRALLYRRVHRQNCVFQIGHIILFPRRRFNCSRTVTHGYRLFMLEIELFDTLHSAPKWDRYCTGTFQRVRFLATLGHIVVRWRWTLNTVIMNNRGPGTSFCCGRVDSWRWCGSWSQLGSRCWRGSYGWWGS